MKLSVLSFSILHLIQLAIIAIIFSFFFWVVYSGVSWLTSGEVGKDVGAFAGEVQQGFQEGQQR